MSPSPGPGNSDRFRQYLENLGRDLEPGSGFFANDPELLLWVAATLLDSSVVAYELFIEPLSAEEKEQLYQQAKRFGQLFGIPEQRYPDSWANFQNWWQQMLCSDTLTVTDTARGIYRGLLTGTWFTRLLAPFNYSMAAGIS